MPDFFIHGLRVRSEWDLPGVLHGDPGSEPDVTFETGELGGLPAEVRADSNPSAGRFWVDDGDYRLAWGELGTLRIRAGREVIAEPQPTAPRGLLPHVLLGAGIASAIVQRGGLPLHAAAARFGQGVVALCADSGGGKSTLSAHLHRRGLALHADDVLAVPAGEGPFEVFPGSCRQRLYPDSLRALGIAHGHLPPIYEGSPKLALDCIAGVRAAPLPLRGLVVLGDGETHALERLDAASAALLLMRQVFTLPNFIYSLSAQVMLDRAAAVARSVPVYRLLRPRDIGQLDRSVECLRREFD